MKLTVLAVGKIKEKWLKEGCEEYSKRLSRFAKFNLIEVADAPDNRSAVEARHIEAERILRKLPSTGYKVALDLAGEAPDSLKLAADLNDWFVQGGSEVTIVIGGSNGFAPNVLAKMDTRIRLSNLTFPHQLVRVILLEQLFRSFKISHNEPYHK